MPRFKLIIEYDGRPYYGWQRQKDAPSVQQAIEEAVQPLNKGELARLHVAGRTDTGVHALAQVAHVDIEREIEGHKLALALNGQLRAAGHAVAIISATKVEAEDWHARFSAKGRRYVYRILNRTAPVTFEKGLVWQVPVPLDINAMQQAANHLLGHHDFTSFRATQCQANSPMRSVDRLEFSQSGEMIEFRAEARSFLHHQIRNFVGSLKLVGEGKHDPDWIKHVLDAKDRRAAGPTAPPDGLYFAGVDYDS
ncbi:MAG: tRNA pseudouridine(38-40) synthase TruA [Alphaproteobacteria bacterium]